MIDSNPNHFIEKVNFTTGEVLDEAIEPEQLLVRHHRDGHVMDVYSRYLMSWLVEATGDEDRVRGVFKEARDIGHRAAHFIADSLGLEHGPVGEALFGLEDREYYFRFKGLGLDKAVVDEQLQELQEAAREGLEAITEEGYPRCHILLTGATGFVGKEILWQAASNPCVARVTSVIRPKTLRDHESGEVIKVLDPKERGRALLDQLWLSDDRGTEFDFIAGDVEQPHLGIAQEDLVGLHGQVTHVIHCAASVSFDSSYKDAFEANVRGSINALELSQLLQEHPESKFVAHTSIETSYIHGREWRHQAREDHVVFPRNFYNNYYELTKAMASLETERRMFGQKLRLIQLCPAIVIGDSRTGNNRGDRKVVNAPVNAFGQAEDAIHNPHGSPFERTRIWMLSNLVKVFPGDPSARLNLISVDRVVEGILAALVCPAAVGQRIHLATDNHITAKDMQRILGEEVGVQISLAEPTMYRNLRLPLLKGVLELFHQEELARSMEKLATIFGGYSEWGQPIHAVGKDVSVLDLSARRPDTEACFRMLCRHNKHVQDFGKVRDLDELSRRERIWDEFIEDLEKLCGRPAGTLCHDDFEVMVRLALDLESFERHRSVGFEA